MKTPREYVAPFDAAKILTTAEAELLIANVLLDASAYKDRIINALFRLKNGESEKAETLAAAPLPNVGAKSDNPVVPAAREKTDALAGVVEVGGPARAGKVPPVAPLKKGAQKVIDFPPDARDTPEVKATKRVVAAPNKTVPEGKTAASALPSSDESTRPSAGTPGAAKPKTRIAPSDEPAPAPLGKAGLPAAAPGVGRTGPAGGDRVGRPVPKRPGKR